MTRIKIKSDKDDLESEKIIKNSSEIPVELDEPTVEQSAVSEENIQEQISGKYTDQLLDPFPYDSMDNKEELHWQRKTIAILEDELSAYSLRRRRMIVPAVPILVLAMIGLALLPVLSEGSIIWNLELWYIFGISYSPSLVICLLLLIAVLPPYYIYFAAPISALEKKLWSAKEKLEALQLSTDFGRHEFLNEKLRSLTKRAAKVFFENEVRRNQAAQWRRDANLAFTRGDLTEAQYLINSIDELILRESREQDEQRTWQWLAVGIMFLYISLLAVFAFFTSAQSQTGEPRLFGIPLAIIVWGATGSLAAILYRFYTTENRIRLAQEVRWLIARPIIGIIMAGLSYLTLVSGLILLGATPSNPQPVASEPIGRIEVYWIFAFLAGFSDKFYLGIIDLLVAKTLPGSSKEADDTPQDLKSRETDHNTDTTTPTK